MIALCLKLMGFTLSTGLDCAEYGEDQPHSTPSDVTPSIQWRERVVGPKKLRLSTHRPHTPVVGKTSPSR